MSDIVSSGQTTIVTGTTNAVEVFGGGVLEVLGGGTASASIVVGELEVSSGGIASGSVIKGGEQTVFAGGMAVATVVNGGTEAVIGGTASGTLLSSTALTSMGGLLLTGPNDQQPTLQIVARGGTTVGTQLWAQSATQIVSSGGIASGTELVTFGVIQIVSAGGVAIGTSMSNLGDTIKIAGGLAVESAGDFSGGSIPTTGLIDFTSVGGGTLELTGTELPNLYINGFDAGGPTQNDAIDLASVAYDGTGTASVSSSGTLTLTEGGQIYDLQLDPSLNYAGEAVQLASDGSGGTRITLVTSGDVVSAGQTETGASDGSGVVIFAGGTLDVAASATASASIVKGVQVIGNGGSAVGTSIVQSGVQYVSAGGTAIGTVIETGSGGEIVAGGVTTGTTIEGYYQSQTVVAGGTASGTVLRGIGDTQIVSTGGLAVGTTALSNVVQTFSNTLEIAGGTAVESAADLDSSALIAFTSVGGGTLEITGSQMPDTGIVGFDAAGPTQNDVIDLASLAFQSGGSTSLDTSAQVSTGGFVYPSLYDLLTVSEGGQSYVLSFGYRGTSFAGEAFELGNDGHGGTAITLAASGFTMVSGQTEELASAASDAVVFSAGTLDVLSGGSAAASLVQGVLSVGSGGTASGTVISGGTQYVAKGGVALGTVIGGGTEEVIGGTATGTLVSGAASGTQIVADGGTTTGTVLGFANAAEIVRSGGVASGTVIDEGAVGLTVSSGGVAVGTVISGGQYAELEKPQLVIAGGLAIVSAGDIRATAGFGADSLGGGGPAVVGFAGGGGTLEITGTTIPSLTISGFDAGGAAETDAIDLAAVAYQSTGGASLGPNNVLTVNEGGQSYQLQFDPSQFFQGDSAQLSNDGHGGTLVTWPVGAIAPYTIVADTPNQVVPISAGAALMFASVPDTIMQTGGASTIVSNAGAMTVDATGGSNTIFDAVGGDLVNEAPSSEFFGGANGATSTLIGASGGADTIFAGTSILYQGGAAAVSEFIGGAGQATVAGAATQFVFAGSGGGVYTPGAANFFLAGGGGSDTIGSGAANVFAFGSTNERLTVTDSTPGAILVAAGNNDSIDAAASGGDNVFFALSEATAGGSYSGSTTLVGATAGGDTFALFAEGSAPPPAHTITIENWQASDKFYLGNYAAADLATFNSALAAAPAGSGASITLSDQTTVTFIGAHPFSAT